MSPLLPIPVEVSDFVVHLIVEAFHSNLLSICYINQLVASSCLTNIWAMPF